MKGTVIDSNRAVCVQPYLTAEGYIPFEISVNSGAYTWKGKYFVETPATAEEKITFTDDSVHQKYPNEIKITWNRYNLTTNTAALVQISIWGYKEVTTRPQFMYIDTLEVHQSVEKPFHVIWIVSVIKQIATAGCVIR